MAHGTMHTPGDDPDAAVAAIRQAAGGRSRSNADVHLLHRSNNVVARIGSLVAKVTMSGDRGIQEFDLAVHGTKVGAPVLPPLREPSVVGGYVITWWPYIEAVAEGADPGALSAALRSFHNLMSSTTVKLRTPEEAARSTLELAMDDRATAAMPDAARAAIVPVLERATAVRTPDGAPVVHGEPHSGNHLIDDGRVVLIDLEGAKRAPVEYDLAFLTEEMVHRYWPEHDAGLLSAYRLVVSAGVATRCWRSVTVRPGDDHHRWHAAHHSEILINSQR